MQVELGQRRRHRRRELLAIAVHAHSLGLERRERQESSAQSPRGPPGLFRFAASPRTTAVTAAWRQPWGQAADRPDSAFAQFLTPGSLITNTTPDSSVGSGGRRSTRRRPACWRQYRRRSWSILREHYGRGPMKAKTYALDDIIVCVHARQRLHPARADDHGQRRARAGRRDARRLPARDGDSATSETIEELTGRKVLAFLSQAHVEPDITMEIFFVDGPLRGLRRRRDHRSRVGGATPGRRPRGP